MRRFNVYLPEFQTAPRMTVLFLHDVGVRGSSWLQWYCLGRSLFERCDVDVVFLDIREARTQPAKWCQIFPRALPLLLQHIGANNLMTVGYGFGAGLFLESLHLLPNCFGSNHVCICPEFPARTAMHSIREKLVAFLENQPETNIHCYWSDDDLFRNRSDIGSRYTQTYECLNALRLTHSELGEIDLRKIMLFDKVHNRLDISAACRNAIIDSLLNLSPMVSYASEGSKETLKPPSPSLRRFERLESLVHEYFL